MQKEISYLRIDEQLKTPSIQLKITDLEQVLKKRICSDLPNALWERKKHIISLPYEPGFDEKNIPTKARPIQMNFQLLEHCKKEILELQSSLIFKQINCLKTVQNQICHL